MALPGYLEDTAKDYAKQATGAYSVPIDTSKFTGSQFVAGEDPLQTSAINLATQGVGSYSPYLTAAQAGLTTAGTDVAGARTGIAAGQAGIGAAGTDIAAARTAAGGLGALTGASAYQPFMSPYQQDVIDTTLTEYDRQAQMQQQQMQDATLGVPGAFGGGREGVQLAEYQAGSDRNRAALQAQMLQQGFGQAQTAAQQAFQNQGAIAAGQLGIGQAQQQFGQNQLAAAQAGLGIGQAQLGLGGAQMGLSNFQRTGMGGDIGALGQLGALRQGQTQAELTANQQAAQTAAYEPYGRLSQYGQGITGLAGGMQGMQYQQPAQSNPWASAIGTAMGVGGLFGKIYG